MHLVFGSEKKTTLRPSTYSSAFTQAWVFKVDFTLAEHRGFLLLFIFWICHLNWIDCAHTHTHTCPRERTN